MAAFCADWFRLFWSKFWLNRILYSYSTIITKAKQSFKIRLRKESDHSQTENVELTTDLNDMNGAGNAALIDDEPPILFQNGCSSTGVETVNHSQEKEVYAWSPSLCGQRPEVIHNKVAKDKAKAKTKYYVNFSYSKSMANLSYVIKHKPLVFLKSEILS